MTIKCCFIRESYFTDHQWYFNLLDTGNLKKQSRRAHLCLCIENNNNRFLIPLRNNLGDDVRKFGRIGHAISSLKRDNAGLDFRYALIVNDDKYIEWPNEQKIPNSQYNKIIKDYDNIKQEFAVYVNGYIKVARKRRVSKEPLYRVSSLQNFNNELGVK